MKAIYFDGKTAQGKDCDLFKRGDHLLIKEKRSQLETLLAVEDFEIGQDGNNIHLMIHEICIVLKLEDFRSLNLKKEFSWKKNQTLIVGPLVIFGLLFTLFFFRADVLNFTMDYIPDDLLENEAQELIKSGLKNPQKIKGLEPFLKKIFERLGEKYEEYQVYVISDNNAYALPGKIIFIGDSLMTGLSSPEALAGILAHEIAHIKKNHVKKSFVGQILTYFIWEMTYSAYFGNAVLGPLQDLIFREYEKEADEFAAELLLKRRISQEGIRSFFQKLESEPQGISEFINWSHPSYPDRIKSFKETPSPLPVLTPEEWPVMLRILTQGYRQVEMPPTPSKGP